MVSLLDEYPGHFILLIRDKILAVLRASWHLLSSSYSFAANTPLSAMLYLSPLILGDARSYKLASLRHGEEIK
jgi:hypothetical protein